MDSALPLEVSPAEVKQRIDSGQPVILVDVRQPEEVQVARRPGGELIPMNTVQSRIQELEAKSDDGVLVIYCHHGMRSLNVVNWLRGQGITDCQSMAGGIDQWSVEIDPSVPRY